MELQVRKLWRPGSESMEKLKQENDRLKKALADEHMKAVLYESWFEIACEQFGVQDVHAFKKN